MSRLTHAALLDTAALIHIGTDHAAALNAYQAALANGKNLLAEYHWEGGDAAFLAKKRSWLIDQILCLAWQRFMADQEKVTALIATGGYGRHELNIESDIDILLLILEDLSARTRQRLESFIQFCWDIGLKVGSNTLTLTETMRLAGENLTVMTNWMEARLLAGNRDLFNTFDQRIRNVSLWPVDRYFREKLDEQRQRHIRFSETAYNLEPNLKESPGGLRDLHMISWVANRYFGTSDLKELVDHHFLTRQEYRALIKGRNYLWRLRNGLHLLSGRCEDRLLFDYQRTLAQQLGYRQKNNHLAVEQMMKKYYRTVKELQLLNELLLQHFQEAILIPARPKPKKINARFQSVGGYLESTRPDIFQREPAAILEMFYLLQQFPELRGVRASTIRQLRGSLHRIDQPYRNDDINKQTFLSIFKHQNGLTHALRRMNAYGVLGAFFPAFGRVVGQMQHDLFHIFTVDAHSLFVVGHLRGLLDDRYKDEFPVLSALMAKLNRRERLYLAALCHDIGKGSGRDHSEVGEQIALTFCHRLGMSDYDVSFVAWLVRHHLRMSWTAQRENTADPRVIDRFAEFVGDQERLDNLYLLTVADMRGTSHNVWNEWKGQLLRNLYTATSRRLRSGLGGAEAIKQRVQDRKRAIEKILADTVPSDQLAKLWEQLDQEYFLRNAPETSAWQAQQIYNADLLDIPIVRMRYREEIRAEQILVVAPESDYLLPKSTGALEKMDLSILDARIHQTYSGLAILVFITVSRNKDRPSARLLEQQTRQLREVLLTPQPSDAPPKRMLPRAYKQFQVPTTVSFSDSHEGRHTTMEIVSPDRPGLLYHVSMALLECKVRLLSAKVSTVGEKAEDTFFITDRDNNPVTSKTQRDCLENRIKSLLAA